MIEGLRGFVGGEEGMKERYPLAAEAGKLREEWVKKGGLATALAAKEKVGGKTEEVYSSPAAPAAAFQVQEKEEKEEKAGGKEEEEEEDDDYDLFGEEEDDEDLARKAAADTGAYQEKRKDSEIYGTLKRLAVDDITLAHVEQTFELPLTPPPSSSSSSTPSIFLLSGPRGVGKTAALYHAVHYARKAGWLVFLLPSAYEYAHEGGLIRPSPFFKGYFDTPDLAQTTLRQLGEAHGHQLASLPLTDPAAAARLGLPPTDSSLLDLITLGIRKRKLATTCLLELKQGMEKQTTYPTLFAIDEVGTVRLFFHPPTNGFSRVMSSSTRPPTNASLIFHPPTQTNPGERMVPPILLPLRPKKNRGFSLSDRRLPSLPPPLLLLFFPGVRLPPLPYRSTRRPFL